MCNDKKNSKIVNVINSVIVIQLYI